MNIKNNLLSAKKIIDFKLFNKKTPLAISWSLTNRCNLKCKYCGSYNQKFQELTTKQVFLIIDQLAKSGTQRISLIGGEPLLRNDIGQIISYCKSKGFHITLTSNGHLVKEKINEILKVDLLKLSLEGPEKIHDFLRCKGSYKKVITSIKLVKSKKIKIVINTTLTKYNITSLESVLNIAKKFKIAVKFQPVSNISDYSSKDLKELIPKTEDYKKIIQNLIDMKNKREPVLNSFQSLEYFKNWPHQKEITCYAGKIICRIAPNGDLFPCTGLENKVKNLNILELGFQKAFDELPETKCKSCWCSSTLELNNLLSLKLKTILNLKKWL